MGPCGIVHMETCSNGKSNGVIIKGNDIIINWVLHPIVATTAMTKMSFAFATVSTNEPLMVIPLPLKIFIFSPITIRFQSKHKTHLILV